MNFAPIPKEVPPHACETVSGRYVDVVNPDPHTISIHDIAWSLARQARYAGHTLGEPYFVAQHACFVKELLEMTQSSDMFGHPLQTSFAIWMAEERFGSELDRGRLFGGQALGYMHALCHDNTEAYLVDLPSPVKRHQSLREPYKALESNLRKVIEQALGIQESSPQIERAVLWADLMALQIEAANLMPSRGRGWSGTLPKFELDFMSMMPKILTWKQAHDQFLKEYNELAKELKIKDYEFVDFEFKEVDEVV